MKNTKIKLFLFLNFILNYLNSNQVNSDQDTKTKKTDLTFSVESSKQHDKIKCLILLLDEKEQTKTISKIIKDDLDFTGQIKTEVQKTSKKIESKIESKLLEKDTSLILYLSEKKNSFIETELRDLSSNSSIIKKIFRVSKTNTIWDTHKISSEISEKLTNDKGIFLHSVTYCKMISPKYKQIYIADYSCKSEAAIVKTKKINVVPCWHTKFPIIFYTQFTEQNNCLRSFDLTTQKDNLVCSYPGLNMQPSFSKDGKTAVLCLSGGNNSELYLYDSSICKKMQKRSFIQLTQNKGNNVSPTLLENGDVIFCSDFETDSPQIYYLNRKTKKVTRLTNGKGYCAAPSYCEKTQTVVYTRTVNGVFQLFSIKIDNFNNLHEKQLTKGYQDKHEPSFSVCGNYVYFSLNCEYSKGVIVPQIAVLNLNYNSTDSEKIMVLTKDKTPKSFPRVSSIPLPV